MERSAAYGRGMGNRDLLREVEQAGTTYRQQENGFMRHNQNRRSRSRNRKGPNPLTRSFESNGPDVKVRGTAAHVAEKYMSLARDAQSSGDIVAAENYLQHAEHYNRIVMAAQAQFQQERQIQFRDGAEDGGYEDDRAMNGRGLRDRFESNVDTGDEEGDDRFDSSEEEMERSFEPRQQPRTDNRDRPRGQRNDRGGDRGDRFERRPDQRPEQRGDQRPDQRSDHGDRPQRFDRANERADNRDGRGEYRNGQRYERGERPQRFGRSDDQPERIERAERSDRGDRAERDERSERSEGRETEIETRQAPLPQLPEAGLSPDAEEAPAPRRRRGRPPRAENGAAPLEGASQDTTPDGAAALVAFPE